LLDYNYKLFTVNIVQGELSMNNKNGETVIDLFDLLGAFLKRIWFVIILTVIGAVIAFGYTFFMVKPLYKSSALMYVNNTNSANANQATYISTGEISAAKSLVDTYAVILESPVVVNEVISLAGVNYSYEQMVSMVEAKSVNNTEVFSITVTSTSPAEAAKLANLYAEVLPAKITAIVNGSDVKVVDYAAVPTHKSSPSLSKNTAIGALLGLLIASAVIVISYLRDDIIHSEDYLSSTYPDIPLLTIVPDLATSASDGYGYYRKAAARKPSAAPAAVNKNPIPARRNPEIGGDKND